MYRCGSLLPVNILRFYRLITYEIALVTLILFDSDLSVIVKGWNFIHFRVPKEGKFSPSWARPVIPKTSANDL